MIITCEECSTRFNLDDSLIKEDGSKVRCSSCKHIFTVFPAPPAFEETTAPIPLPVESDAPQDDTEPDTEEDTLFEEPAQFEMEDSDYSIEDTDLGFDEPSLDAQEESPAEPEEMDPEADPADPMDQDFSFDEGELQVDEPEEELSLELDDSPVEEDATLDFDDADPEEFDSIEFEALDDDSSDFQDEPDDSPEFEVDLEADIEDADASDTADPAQEDDFSSVDDYSAEDDFELEFDVSEDDPAPDDLPTEEAALDLDAEQENDDGNLELSLDDDEPDDQPPALTPEEDFSQYDAVLEQETEPEQETVPEEETDDLEETFEPVDESLSDAGPAQEMKAPEPMTSEPAMDPRRRRKKKKPLIGTPVLILILIFFLVAGAYIASLMTGYKIPYLSDIKIPALEKILKKPAQEVTQVKPVPNQKSVNGRFVTNTTAGTLFVITGTVDNPSQSVYSHIEVKGALIVKDKVEAKTKNAYCGNIITEEMLKTGNITDINKLLAVKQGKHNANVKIKPGTSIPFMIVFSDLPEKLQNFTVKVTQFEKN